MQTPSQGDSGSESASAWLRTEHAIESWDFRLGAFSLWSWALIASAMWVSLVTVVPARDARIITFLCAPVAGVLIATARIRTRRPVAGYPSYALLCAWIAAVACAVSLSLAAVTHAMGLPNPTPAQTIALGVPGIVLGLSLLGLVWRTAARWRRAFAQRELQRSIAAFHEEQIAQASQLTTDRLRLWFVSRLAPFSDQEDLSPEDMLRLSSDVVRPASHAILESPVAIPTRAPDHGEPVPRVWLGTWLERWRPPTPWLVPSLLVIVIGPSLVVSEGLGVEAGMLVALALVLAGALWVASRAFGDGRDWRWRAVPVVGAISVTAVAFLLPPLVRLAFERMGLETTNYFPLPSFVLAVGTLGDSARMAARSARRRDNEEAQRIRRRVVRLREESVRRAETAKTDFAKRLHGPVQSALIVGSLRGRPWRDVLGDILRETAVEVDASVAPAVDEWHELMAFWREALPVDVSVDDSALAELLATPASKELLFAAVGECLTNALKYTDGSLASLEIQSKDPGLEGGIACIIESGRVLERDGADGGVGFALLERDGVRVTSGPVGDAHFRVRLVFGSPLQGS